jgi:catechol 2,3-dioxygenase-like lactoylglutathione lyase family enzyme
MAIQAKGVTPLLQVYDMPTSLRFYRDMLGFRVINTSPVLGPDQLHWAMLQLGDAVVMLNTAYEFDYERPAEREPATVAAHGDVTLYFSCPDVDGAYTELQGRGLALNRPHVAPYGMRQLDFRDPDGYGLCFQWPSAA